MTSPTWAREEAERIVAKFQAVNAHNRDAYDLENLIRHIASALLAAERRAKEECARIADGDEAAHADCGHEDEYWDGRTDAAIAIRSTIKESP